MKRHLVIARREFRYIALRPRFLIMALIPLAVMTFFVGSAFFFLKFAPPTGSAFLFSDGQSTSAREFSEQVEREFSTFSEARRPAELPQSISAEDFKIFADQHLGTTVETGKGPKPLGFIVWATPDRSEVKIWTTDEGKKLIEPFRQHLARLTSGEHSPSSSDSSSRATAEVATAKVELSVAPVSTERALQILKRMSGILFAFLFFFIVLINSTALLQSMTEEKSSRLLESLLALATPQELFGGKLLGMAAVALSMFGFWWVAVVYLSFQFLPPEMLSTIGHTLAWLTSVQGVVLAVFYFLSAFLMMAMPLLAVGAMSESAQDSGPYQLPIVLVFVPILVFLSLSAATPEPRYLAPLSWVPIYTPFAMPTRLADGVSALEILGTAATMLIFMFLEYKLAGRIIRYALLKDGPRPHVRRTMAIR